MKKNLITVLKKLLTAFGGDSEQVKNNAVDIIDKIADNASSGGSSGGETLFVIFEHLNTPQDPHYQSATTYKQAMDAFKEGRQVVFYFPKNSTYVGTASDVWFSMAGIDFSNPGDGETYPMIILSRLDQGGSAISQSSGQINDIDAPIEWSFYFD